MTGYTLLEGLFVVLITSLLATVAIAGWPIVRQRQALLLAEQQIQSLVRQAEQQAFQFERSQDCLSSVGSSLAEQRTCSDLGLAFNQDKVRFFADTQGDDNKYTTDDFLLTEYTLPSGVVSTVSGWQSILFRAVPPRVTLYDQSGDIVGADSHATLNVRIGDSNQDILIFPYGQVQVQ